MNDWAEVQARAYAALSRYDPNQPRDEDGKWSGGGSSGSDEGEHPGEGYSASARVVNGVIHTSSVYDAQRALYENRKVELNQPRTVSVLLKRLGEVAQKMIEQGKEAPVFNLCNVTVKGTNLFCADTKGIPRVQMPQLDPEQTKAFVKHLKESGFGVEKEKVKAAHLRATQNEINGAKVARTAEKMRGKAGKITKRLVVSKDDYILDGHHHWAAKVGLDAEDGSLTNDTKVKVSRVNISITKLLAEAEKFTGGKGHVGVEAKGLGDIVSDLVREWDESEHPRDEHGRFAFSSGGDTASASDFIAARDKSGRMNFLSPLKPQDLSQHTLIMNKEKTVGVAVDKQGDLQNLFNNGGPKGAAADMVVAAIGHGAKTLDAYEGFLPDYYRNFGFRETGRMKFNPALAHDWDIAKQGTPDVVFMAWNGYVDGAGKAVARAKGPRTDWIDNEPTSNYETDYDAAKAASRAAARGTGNNRGAGAQPASQADRTGNLSGARTGEGHRRTVTLKYFDAALKRTAKDQAKFLKIERAHEPIAFAIRQWQSWRLLSSDELTDTLMRFNPNHAPGGSPEGGQFISGGGSGGDDEGLSGSAVDEFLDKYGLHSDDQKKIASWLGSGYRELRTDPNFAKTLEKLPKYSGRVYRGTRLKPEEVAKLKPGTMYNMEKFSSSSPRRSVAEEYMQDAQRYAGDKKVTVMMEINDAGRKLPRDMAGYYGSDAEEVVLMQGDKYKVTAVEPAEDDDGNQFVRVRMSHAP